MKYITTALLLSFFFVSYSQRGNSLTIDEKGKAKYPAKSGQISYTISGGATGTATLYFDRNGWRQVLIKEISFERYGIKSTEKTVELTDGDYQYKVNLDSKKGTKSIDFNWSKMAAYKDSEDILRAIMEDQGATSTGDTALLDHTVTIWTFKAGTTTTLWNWKGIDLKEIKSVAGLNYEMTATDFLKDSPIDESVFELPEGIIWTD